MKRALSNSYKSIQAREAALEKAYMESWNQTNSLMDEQTEAEKKAIAAKTMSLAPEEMLKAEVLAGVTKLFPNTYSDQHIREVFDAVHKKSQEITDSEILTGKVVKKLLNGNTDRRRTGKPKGAKTEKVEASEMLSFVNQFRGDPNDPLK